MNEKDKSKPLRTMIGVGAGPQGKEPTPPPNDPPPSTARTATGSLDATMLPQVEATIVGRPTQQYSAVDAATLPAATTDEILVVDMPPPTTARSMAAPTPTAS